MPLERYEYAVSKSFLNYEFNSIGPHGKIKKLIALINSRIFYSLAFGDYIEDTGEINVMAISDNKDTEKILGTLFSALLDFTNHFPGKWIYAIGSTESRTRLYQMSIAKYWDIIDSSLLVYGRCNAEWKPFEKNSKYDAFLFARKW